MAEQFFFWLFSFLAIFTSLMVILQRNALSCAFFLILSFINLAGLYVLLDAHFLAIAQILVYAGAIMVLFLFVIMLLNMGADEFKFLILDHSQWPAFGVTFLSLGSFLWIIVRDRWAGVAHLRSSMPEVGENYGNIDEIARLMFTQYLVPFELISLALLVATVGVVLLAKRVI